MTPKGATHFDSFNYFKVSGRDHWIWRKDLKMWSYMEHREGRKAIRSSKTIALADSALVR